MDNQYIMTLFDVFDLNSKRYNDGFEFLMSRLSNNYESYNGSTNKSKKKAFIWIKCALKTNQKRIELIWLQNG